LRSDRFQRDAHDQQLDPGQPPRAMFVSVALGFICASSSAPIAWCDDAEQGSTSTSREGDAGGEN
jgi:hypothetical protein